MSNVFAQFKKLLPNPSLEVGTVTAISGGTASITLPGGGKINARGSATVGSQVYVRNGVIEGPAPSLSVLDITV